MNLGIVQMGAKQVGLFMMRNSPSLLTAVATGGVATSVILAITGTTKAMDAISFEEACRIEKSMQDKTDMPGPLSRMDILKIVWRFYVPTTLIGLGTIGCIIGANSIHLRRNAALASLYGLAETTLREYQEKVVEVIGRGKEEKIRQEINQDTLDRNPVDKAQVIITGKGEYLCYESISGRYFKSDIEKIRKAQNDFNEELVGDLYASLSDWYSALGLESTAVSHDQGWSIQATGQLHITFDTKLSNGEPCIIIGYDKKPRPLTEC